MGKWLSGGKAPAGSDEWIGFLDRGVKLEGSLELDGTFRVDGTVKGTIRCKERLIVGENGYVEGEIDGTTVSVAGKVRGKVGGSDRVEIHASGTVEGEVHTSCLVIEAGGVLEGRCHMKSEFKEAAASTSQPVGLRVRPSESSS